MFKSLGKIKNPLVRSATAASTALAMTTLIVVLAIHFTTNPKNKAESKAAHQKGVYATFLALIAGAGLGLMVKDSSPTIESTKQNKVNNSANSTVWQDWRNFKVVKKVPESNEITSFYLKPVDGESLPNFKPGQFLTIKLDIPEESRPVIRTYSLSDYAYQDHYRLSIKKEAPPKGLDVPPGVASNFMHDHVTEGSVIPCKPPNGKFFLEVDKSSPVVLISNGVGITPMIAMASACAKQNLERHVWFIHGARNGEYHACREEVNAIANTSPNLHIHYCYSRPRPEDEGKYHTQGYADKQLIADTVIPAIKQHHQGLANAEYYLCGSPAFMDSLRAGLGELEVLENNIFFESFGGGKTKGKTQTKNNAGKADSAEVVFSQSNKTVTWTPADGTLLEFAEANDINPDYSCRQGVCMTCMCGLEEGEVEYTESPASEPDEGSVLICISKPKTAKIVLDL